MLTLINNYCPNCHCVRVKKVEVKGCFCPHYKCEDCDLIFKIYNDCEACPHLDSLCNCMLEEEEKLIEQLLNELEEEEEEN